MHDFDTVITPEGQGQYRVCLSENWSINNTPNGGYIMGVLARAMARECGLSARTAILTANYLDRCDQRPARILVETMGESGSFIRLQARLVQNERERIRAMATFLRPSASGSDSRAVFLSGPESVAPREVCVQVPPVEGYSLYGAIDLRLDPASAGWMENRFSDRAVMKGWIDFKDPRPVDLEALALFADCFPPAVFANRGRVAWVPTVEYSVNVRQRPVHGSVKGIFSSRFISQGLVEEDGELWDEAGNLLAISRQIAKYLPVE